jgi:hypothetical protein
MASYAVPGAITANMNGTGRRGVFARFVDQRADCLDRGRGTRGSGAEDARSLTQAGSRDHGWWWRRRRNLDMVTRYDTAEYYMMIGKAGLLGDDAIAAQMLTAPRPGAVKALGRQVRDLDQVVWDAHCFDLVVAGNVAKFRQHPGDRRGAGRQQPLVRSGTRTRWCSCLVERASRSRRALTRASPSRTTSSALSSSGRRSSLPDALSMKIGSHPASVSASHRDSGCWSRVDTRPYPMIATS